MLAVYGCFCALYPGKAYVVKEIDLGPMTPRAREEAMNEADLLRSMEPHPNVINYVDMRLDLERQKLSLVLEYADSGDIAAQISARKALLDKQNGDIASAPPPSRADQTLCCKPIFFKEEHVMLVFLQCLFGLHHLHTRHIMHRDIKTANIFLFSNGLVKLGDFGIAKSFKHKRVRNTYVGTPLYMAPEMHSENGYTFKADIWALGCVLYELCCLKHPYSGKDTLWMHYKVSVQ